MTATIRIADRVEIGFDEVTSIGVPTKCHNDESKMCRHAAQTNVATMPTVDSINGPALDPGHVQVK